MDLLDFRACSTRRHERGARNEAKRASFAAKPTGKNAADIAARAGDDDGTHAQWLADMRKLCRVKLNQPWIGGVARRDGWIFDWPANINVRVAPEKAALIRMIVGATAFVM